MSSVVRVPRQVISLSGGGFTSIVLKTVSVVMEIINVKILGWGQKLYIPIARFSNKIILYSCKKCNVWFVLNDSGPTENFNLLQNFCVENKFVLTIKLTKNLTSNYLYCMINIAYVWNNPSQKMYRARGKSVPTQPLDSRPHTPSPRLTPSLVPIRWNQFFNKATYV